MRVMRRLFISGVVLVLALNLVACGGKEERKAKYLERGKAYLAEKNYDKARIEFKNVLQIDPKDANGFLYLGQVEEKKQNWQKAFNTYRKASELDPDLIEARVRLAKIYLAQAGAMRAREDKDGLANAMGMVQEQIKEIQARDPENLEGLTLEATLWITDGDTDKAAKQLERVIGIDPGLQSAALLLSGIYDGQGRSDDAEAVLVKAVQASSDPIVLQLRLSDMYRSQNKNEKAEEMLRTVISDNPDKLSYRVSLASLLAQTEQMDKAETVLRDAIAADPEDVQRYRLLADFLASRRSQQVAIDELKKNIEDNPELTDLNFVLLQVYIANEQMNEARQHLEVVIEQQGTEPAGLKARVALAQMLIVKDMQDERVPELIGVVLAENPRDNDALVLRGRLAAYKKDYVGAINDFRSVLKDQPDSAQVLLLLTSAHLANEESDLARDTLMRAVERNQDNVDLRLALVRLLVQENDTDAALTQLDAVLKIEENNEQALKAKYELLARKGDAAGVEEVSKRMQAAAPEKEDGYISEARLRLAQKDYGAALELLDGVLEKNPDSVAALVTKSDVLAAEKEYAAAISVVDKLQHLHPDSAEPYFRKGRLFEQQGDVAAAVAQYEMALQKAPQSAEVLRALVAAETGQDGGAKAEQRLLALLEQDPQHSSANTLLGLLYSSQKDYAKAEKVFQRQVEITPQSVTAYSQLAQVRVAQERLDDAAAAHEQGLKAVPGDTRLMIGLAGVREQQKDFEAAIAIYEQVLEQHPKNAISTNNLAALLSDHRTDAASLDRAAELAVDLEKTNQPAFLDTAGWIYYRKGDYARAVEVLKDVVEKAPQVPVFRYHLGMAYFRLGDKSAAAEHLTRATDGDFKYDGVEEARATLKAL